MKSFEAKITIHASPDRIWSILTDEAGYPEWDPGMLRVEGRIAPAGRVKFFTRLSPDQAFAVRITAFEHGKKMVFTGGMPFGLFKSERTHTLKPAAGGGTEFQTTENFSGLLLPVFGKNLPDLTQSFENFAAGLKAKAENTAG